MLFVVRPNSFETFFQSTFCAIVGIAKNDMLINIKINTGCKVGMLYFIIGFIGLQMNDLKLRVLIKSLYTKRPPIAGRPSLFESY
jgi:hypothetical protein